jgi:hypothetical protein
MNRSLHEREHLSLLRGYVEMASDAAEERKALEWSNGLIGDISAELAAPTAGSLLKSSESSK